MKRLWNGWRRKVRKMMIDLTKEQCESLIDYIEMNLLDVIRNDTDIDNICWVQNILTAKDAMEKAVAEGE